MKNEIKEISRLPGFILLLFAVQIIVVLFLYFNRKETDLGVFYVLFPVALILAVFKLTVLISVDSFKYKLFPFHFFYKKIAWEQIEMIQFSKIDALYDFLGWGLRYSGKYGWGYIFNSGDVILIRLKNGKKRAVTIKDRVSIIQFLTANNIPFKVD